MSFVRGVVGQIEEEADVVHGTILLKVRLKEPGCLHIDLVEEETLANHFGTYVTVEGSF